MAMLESPRPPGPILDLPDPKPEDSGGWTPVRDSWTEPPPPPPARTRSSPPPLPPSASAGSLARASADSAFGEVMLERLAADDYAGALMAAEALLQLRPRDRDALDCAEMSRAELRKTYVARLGSLARVPHVAMGPEAIASLHLDFRGGFLLSRVDGLTSLEEIAGAGGLAPFDALRILSELYLHRVIAFDD